MINAPESLSLCLALEINSKAHCNNCCADSGVSYEGRGEGTSSSNSYRLSRTLSQQSKNLFNNVVIRFCGYKLTLFQLGP